MHVDAVQRNPQNASAQQLRLSVSLYTIFGSFCRDCPGSRCTSQFNNVVCSPSFCNRSSFISPSSSSSSSSSPSANASVADL